MDANDTEADFSSGSSHEEQPGEPTGEPTGNSRNNSDPDVNLEPGGDETAADVRTVPVAGALTFFDTLTQTYLTLVGRTLTTEQVVTASSALLPSCRLWLEVEASDYARILEREHFYLSPQLFMPAQPSPFRPGPVQMSLRLHPELFATLPDSLRAAAPVLPAPQALWDYLQNQNQHNPHDALFAMESWMALAVWQPADAHADPAPQLDARGKGFRTLWNELTPSFSRPDSMLGDDTLAAIFSFLTQRGEFDGVDVANMTGVGDRVNELAQGLAQFNRLWEAAATDDENFMIAESSEADEADEGSAFITISELFTHYFETVEWPYTPTPAGHIMQLYASGENGSWACFALAREEYAQAIFYSRLPFAVPHSMRPTLAELLTRINYALAAGNFEMDWDDGEVRFKTSLSAEGQEVTLGWLHNMVETNLSSMDYYLPALMAVVQKGQTPAEALAALEDGGEDAENNNQT